MNCTTLMPVTTFPQPRNMPDVSILRPTKPSELKTLAAGFDPISLKQMDAVALLNRIDKKFAMSTRQLLISLKELQHDYWILTINHQQLNLYRTLYFDTPEFELYNAHVNGRAERFKVRSREYTDTNLSFLEVKHKTRKDRTIKSRIALAQPAVEMTTDMEKWLRSVSPLDGGLLEPKLWNTFTRMTLVNKQFCERVTLDVDLRFYTDTNTIHLDGIAIAEGKMNSCNQGSPFLAQMRAQRIRSQGFSKYSIGVSMLYNDVKKNSLKPKLLWLEKVMKGNEYCE